MDSDRVVLMGHNYSTILGFARALGKKGYEVYAVRTGAGNYKSVVNKVLSKRPKPDSVSRFVKKFVMVNINDTDTVLRVLMKTVAPKNKRGVLIPVDDLCAMFIDSHLDLLRKRYLLPNVNNTQGGVIRLMDKGLQKKLAEEAGLPVAGGWTVVVENGKYDLPEEVKYPCFMKAQMPMASRKDYMAKCDNEEELIRALDKAAAYRDCKILIEEYIKIKQEYCVVGFCNREKVCIPEVIEETVLGHGPHAGVTCFGKVMKPDLMAGFIEKMRIFLGRLDFQGFFTADVFETDAGYIFCELNLRIGGSGTAVIGAGVDIVSMYVVAILEKADIPYDSVCNEITFASERPLLSDYVLGYISWKDYSDYIRTADFRFMFDKKDKAPYYSYSALVLSGIARRSLHMVRHRHKDQKG